MRTYLLVWNLILILLVSRRERLHIPPLQPMTYSALCRQVLIIFIFLDSCSPVQLQKLPHTCTAGSHIVPLIRRVVSLYDLLIKSRLNFKQVSSHLIFLLFRSPLWNDEFSSWTTNLYRMMTLELNFQRFWSNTNPPFTTALLKAHWGNNASVRVSALVRRKWAWYLAPRAIIIVNKNHDVTMHNASSQSNALHTCALLVHT